MVFEMSKPQARVHAVMAENYGLIRRDEALRAPGMTAAMIDGLLQRGRWEAVQRSVYRVAGGYVPGEQAHLAAVWRAGDDAVLTAEPVMALFGVEGFALGHGPVVLCPRHRRVRGVQYEVRYRELSRGERAKSGPIAIAVPSRAFVDLAARVRGKAFRVAFDSARRLGLVSTSKLARSADAALPQHGARWVLDLVTSGILDQESEGERVVARLFEGHSPPLEFQAWLLEGVRVDAVWRDARLVVEYDGKAHHTYPADREHDRRRRARLRAAGWSVFVVTNDMLGDLAGLRRRILRRRETRLRQLA